MSITQQIINTAPMPSIRLLRDRIVERFKECHGLGDRTKWAGYPSMWLLANELVLGSVNTLVRAKVLVSLLLQEGLLYEPVARLPKHAPEVDQLARLQGIIGSAIAEDIMRTHAAIQIIVLRQLRWPEGPIRISPFVIVVSSSEEE